MRKILSMTCAGVILVGSVGGASERAYAQSVSRPGESNSLNAAAIPDGAVGSDRPRGAESADAVFQRMQAHINPASDDDAQLSNARQCALDRMARASDGQTGAPVICELARGEFNVSEGASTEQREMQMAHARDGRAAMSAVDELMRRSSGDYIYCKVLLCMAAIDGPESVTECLPVIDRFRRMLRANVDIPACPMVGLDGDDRLSVWGEVGNQGRVRSSTGAGHRAIDDALMIGGYGQAAHQRYGIACNDAETMIRHSGENEALPLNAPPFDWSYRGSGNTAIAAWEYQPDWWRNANPQFAGHDAWNRLLPWFVVFEGEHSRTSSVDVQIGRMSVQWFSRQSQSWELLDYDASWEFSVCPQSSNYYQCPMGRSFAGQGGYPAFTNGNGSNGHGWFEMLTLPDPRDVGALTVSVEARLIGANANDAQLLMHVGADIYPPPGTPQTMVAGAAISSMRIIGTQWTSVSMTTFTEQTRNGTGISHDALRRNPPPCAAPMAQTSAEGQP